MMRIHSFVAPEQIQKETLTLSSTESHHLARVLRVEAGQELTLFDGQGTRADAVITHVDKKGVEAKITARETIEPPPVEITLIQAVCKADRFEMILQKATELGVRTIQPVVTQNASLPAGKIEKMVNRGEAIIRNASQQCGTAWLPNFHRLRRLSELFPSIGKTQQASAQPIPNIGNFDAVFIGSLYPDTKPFRDVFQTLEKSEIKTAALLIGPEGDFTEEEVSAAIEAGAIPVTFGKQILRTETAAIFGLSVLAYELF